MDKTHVVDSRGQVRRSTCPTNYVVELIGDRWSLLIIRDLLFNDKHTFGDLLSSQEGVARNILAARLKSLEQDGLITKTPHPQDGRKEVYALTEKGRQLESVLAAMAAWAFTHEPMTLAHKPVPPE